MAYPTPEQQDRANKVDAAVLELLSLDVLHYDSQDHIAYATELVQQVAKGFALALEVAKDELDPASLNANLRWVAEMHVRLAQARRA